MSTWIAGHTLTRAERETLDAMTAYMRANARDTGFSPTTSPNGDGREIPLDEVFPNRDNRDNARRRTIARLHKLGVLRACEIRLERGLLKAVPFESFGKIAIVAV